MQVESTSKPMLTVDEADACGGSENQEQRMSRHRLRGILCAKEISSA